MQHSIEADFLIVGGGAMGLAFADEILSTTTCSVVIVDRRAGPGGHWNDAYNFVRLHQPAKFYGVNSAELSRGGGDLASKPEILAYFERVVDRWRATGRLIYLANVEMGDDGVARSVLGDGEWHISARWPVVDATWSRVQVPATHPPNYAVSPDARLVPVGGLWRLDGRCPHHVVIGAGKTGYDALLYLLGRGVDPERITWIVSRDAWLYPREMLQPHNASWEMINQIRATADCVDPEDVYPMLETRGWWQRLDTNREPTMFRCATVDRAEVSALRRIKNVVRMGRVQRVEPERLVLDGGRLAVEPGALFVDCTADGLVRRPQAPVFTADRITLQPLVVCQQVMSAALIAAMTVRLPDDETRNGLARPVPHPDVPSDYIRCLATTFENLYGWLHTPWMAWWAGTRRLSAASNMSLWRHLRLGVGLERWAPSTREGLAKLVARLDG